MSTRIQIRRGNATQWSTANPILAAGELGLETDTNLIKVGDGQTVWNSLDYFADVDSASASLIGYVDERIEDVVGLSPETLDTLEELAAALGDDPDFFNTISASVTSASAFALAEANDYTDGEVATAIVTASAAAAGYVDQELLDYLTISSASSTYATKTELENIDALPDQTGNAGKYLTTDGSTASWDTVEGGGGGTASDDTIFKAQLFFGGSN
jgi:hypothetical protein